MNTLEKLQVLGAGTKWDACTPGRSQRRPEGDSRIGAPYGAGVCKSFTPDGRCVSLLKVLQTNVCVHDCKYCMHSTNCRWQKKAEFDAEELAKLFMNMYLGNYVEGLFLSSGVVGNETRAFEKMHRTVEILRGGKYNYQGYIHLKVMPGADPSHIKALAEVADRVSLNAECPNSEAFSEICTTKDYGIDIERRLRMINHVKGQNEITSGVTTQMVVGAAGETDRDYLDALERMYLDFGLKKAYFSAFDPVQGTPLEKEKGTPLRRENFLYRVDWLLRFYHFDFREVKTLVDEDGMMPLNIDPKVNFALHNPEKFPVDINSAGIDELLHVPGIGVQGAQRILKMREHCHIRGVDELKATGITLSRAMPFLQVNGARQSNLTQFCAQHHISA
ncbi:Biotin synthase [uncultured archaeon]|nr:Biotin synthase [uncultured archaeon]